MAISKAKVLEICQQKQLECLNIQDYKTLETPLQFKCSKGHEFTATFRTVRDDRFKCAGCEGKQSLGALFFGTEPPKKNGRRIVAIDNATKNAGVSVFDNGKLSHYQLVQFDGETIERMLANKQFLVGTIIQKWHPDLIVLEDIQSQKNVQTFKALAMLLGSTRVALKEYNVPVEMVTSAKWRAHFMISGDRIADKKQAIDKVMEMYGIAVTDDVAEAILLGKYAVDMSNASKPIKLF